MHVKANDIDQTLFIRIQKNDRLALNTLFAHYYQKLCFFANTYLRNSLESEEVVADVFFTIWKNRHTLIIEKNFKSYLYVSARHASLAAIKKRQPLFEDIEDILFSTNLLDATDPEKILTYKELQHQLDIAIEGLPSRCKQIFLMSRMEGLSYKQISDILGIAEKTIENQLVKALRILRDSMNCPRENEVNIVTYVLTNA
ncbi:MAG TPA: RNA polymerase sigma-70 factor [Chryseolinea sp.]|nr:RNA polymerase sigma-70 factor [Chryseolinea sp.]HPM31918.1 RNA polymerase sigma-70 factor [Chryseolinea sp.]